MSTPEYKLVYFDGRGTAEPIRLIFRYANIEFEDRRLAEVEWPLWKPDVPFEQLPVLQKDGKMVNQSIAIERYVAKLAKLTGSDDFEDLEIDAIVDTINDMRMKMFPVFYESDGQVKERKLEELKEDTVKFYLGKFEGIAEKNGGYLAVNRLSWADFHFTGICDVIEDLWGERIFDDYPTLRKVRSNVLHLPGVKEYVANRIDSEF